MPSPELKTPAPAGVSSEAEVDVAALVERLREELAGGRTGIGADRARLLDVRHRAERVWAVTAERPLERRPGAKGLVARPVKRLLRPFLRWYVEPLAAEQRMFNDAVLKLFDALLAGLDEAARADGEAARTLTELEARLTRVERRPAGAPAAPSAAPQPAATAVPDYFAFEARMRGSTDDVRARQRVYVDDFHGAAPVLDVGCGRGEFLV